MAVVRVCRHILGLSASSLICGNPLVCFPLTLLQIPLPVTTGLFLYLGVSGLKGNEMWERTKLLITDKTLRPKVIYFRSFRTAVILLRTRYQVLC